jgi:nucleolar protein 6
MKQGERKEKKAAKQKKGENDDAEEEEEEAPEAGMHPARLAMLQAPQRPVHRQRY